MDQSSLGRFATERVPICLALVTGNANQARVTSLETLTYREHQISSLISCGARNREIAPKLAVAQRTVKAHVTAIFRKPGVSDRVRLALLMTG